jgi:hypothetical protein
MDDSRREHLKMIQDTIARLAQCSFQLKGWSVTLAVALEVFLKGEASPAYLFVPALPILAFWLLDAWFLRRERLFRKLFDEVRSKQGPSDFSMDVQSFHKSIAPTLGVAASPTILAFYGPVLFVIVVLGFILSQ